MNTTQDPLEQEYYRRALPVYQIAIPTLMALCFVGVLANAMLLYTSKNVNDPHPTLKLTYSLAASDLWSLLITFVSLFLNSYLPFVAKVAKFPSQDCYMHALEALRLGALVTSVLHLLALAVSHYVVTAHPLCHRQRLAPAVKPAVAVLWLLPPLTFLIVFLCFYDRTFGEADCKATITHSNEMRICLFALVAGALLLTSAVYVGMVSRLRAMQQGLLTGRRANFVRRRTRTMLTALLIISTFLLGWLPGVVWFLITCQSCLLPVSFLYKNHPDVIYSFGIAVNLLMILKAIINPIIYASRMPEIHDSIRRSRRSLRRQNQNGIETMSLRMTQIRSKISITVSNVNSSHTDVRC